MSNKKPTAIVFFDEPCQGLLQRTAARNHVSIQSLIETSVNAFIGSIEHYGVKAPAAEGRKAPRGQGMPFKSNISKKLHEKLNAIGVFLDVSVNAMVRDSILGQRFNFQRMQPVNARSMGSVRMTLFKMENASYA
jgi:hypothetical protein